MEYKQKFIPEGWKGECRVFSLEELNAAALNGEVIQGKVTKCDSNYNLYLDLGNNITGIIPREEVEAVNVDETGFPKPNICTSKIDKFVQTIETIEHFNGVIKASMVLAILQRELEC